MFALALFLLWRVGNTGRHRPQSPPVWVTHKARITHT